MGHGDRQKSDLLYSDKTSEHIQLDCTLKIKILHDEEEGRETGGFFLSSRAEESWAPQEGGDTVS